MKKLSSIKGKLNIAKEERASGAVSGSVYATYIKASKSWLPLVAYLFFQLVKLVGDVMMRLTQASWATISLNSVDSKNYLGAYGIYLTSFIISFCGSGLLLAIIMVNSARWDNYAGVFECRKPIDHLILFQSQKPS